MGGSQQNPGKLFLLNFFLNFKLEYLNKNLTNFDDLVFILILQVCRIKMNTKSSKLVKFLLRYSSLKFKKNFNKNNLPGFC